MLSNDFIQELRASWLPHMTPCGLDRIIHLLETNSPLLIHGSFTRIVPMGCLATHVAWNHPETEHLTLDAGLEWLSKVAHLNPATSHVIREWDRSAECFEFRQDLLSEFKDFRQQSEKPAPHVNRIAHLHSPGKSIPAALNSQG